MFVIRASLRGKNIMENFAGTLSKLWAKPETRDERIKEYVPEVLEESLQAQKAVIAESTQRDTIVDRGSRVLQLLENKTSVPSVAPHFEAVIQEYGGKALISQRALSYLFYPSSSNAAGNTASTHELVLSFGDNFKALIDEIETNGCGIRERSQSTSQPEQSATTPDGVQMVKKSATDSTDITLFVKIAASMALANIQCGELSNAIKCCDIGLRHAQEDARRGALLGIKAGVLYRLLRYEDCAETARLAIAASQNPQGYLHGSAALGKLNRRDEELAMLESGLAAHPQHADLSKRIEGVRQLNKVALPAAAATPTPPALPEPTAAAQ